MQVRSRVSPSFLILSGLLLLGACTPETSEEQHEARIRRTSFGIPHIEARDLASLGFGEGYAHAEDHLCTVADLVVAARGERARYFGPGENNKHLGSDAAIKALRIRERAAEDFQRQPEEIKGWYRGYVAGYNKYLEETGKENVAGWCRGGDWVAPITVEDLAGWHRMSVVQMPYEMIAGARPPSQTANIQPPSDASVRGASNGWALGKELTENGRGMLLANPHYLWVGALRFWEKHLVIPGEMNVYGAHILGVPGVAIGFNEAVGWTHTISAGKRETFYALDLVPGKPTTYRYGDEEREMTPRAVEVEIRGQDGALQTIEQTLYFTHYGPVVNIPGVGWTNELAVALRSANQDNEEGWRQWLAMNRAGSLEEFQQAIAEIEGLGYVNTIATTVDGVAFYADTAAVANLSPEAIETWNQRREKDPLTKQLWQRRLVLLDGSDPSNEWLDDEGARDPGIVDYEKTPRLERNDYVFNSNDSYWLANAEALLTGPYSPLHGEPNTPRSLRTRQNALTISDRSAEGPAGEDGKFSLDEVADAVLSNRGLTAELIRPELVERCRKTSSVQIDGERVDLAEACNVLAEWDGRYDLDSRGAVLFREFVGTYGPTEFFRRGRLFAVPFDPKDPLHTPRGLAPAAAQGDLALQNLARAVKLLRSRAIPLDVPLGELQYANRPGERIPIHGGLGSYEGILNFEQNAPNSTTLEPHESPQRIEGSRFLTEKGYPVAHGASFLMVLQYTDQGPEAKALLTYGESGDPESEHFTDQMKLFSNKQWRPVLFREEEIAADTQREYTVRAKK